jgi:hypothetical protein
VLIGEERCRTIEDFKSWSQNLGHEKVFTTLTSYGKVPEHRQGQVIKRLATVDIGRADMVSARVAN